MFLFHARVQLSRHASFQLCFPGEAEPPGQVLADQVEQQLFGKMLASCGNDVGEAEPPAIVCTLPLFGVCLRACAQYLLFCAACPSWHKVHATCLSRRPRLIQAATHWQAPALRPAPVGQSQ